MLSTTPVGSGMPGTGRAGRVARVCALAFTTCGVVVSGLLTAGPATAAPATTTSVSTTSTVAAASTNVVRYRTAAALTASSNRIKAGQVTWLTGRLTFGPQHRPVRGLSAALQRWTGKSWRTVSWHTTTSTGKVTFKVKPSTTTQYRIYFPTRTRLTSAVSPKVKVTVTMSRAAMLRLRVAATAAKQIGKPYVFGAVGPSSFDCSGLTQYAFKSAGVRLPHLADSQKRYGHAVSRSKALPGDLVVFLSGGYSYHVAVYAGGGQIYEAANPGAPVRRKAIWSSNVQFRRLIG